MEHPRLDIPGGTARAEAPRLRAESSVLSVSDDPPDGGPPLRQLRFDTGLNNGQVEAEVDMGRVFLDSLWRPRHPTLLFRQIHEYIQRDFSFEEDALDAFKGILAEFDDSSHLQSIYFHGVPLVAERWFLDPRPNPSNILASGLAWRFCSPMVRRPAFPSYSWAGWKPSPRKPWTAFVPAFDIVGVSALTGDATGFGEPFIRTPGHTPNFAIEFGSGGRVHVGGHFGREHIARDRADGIPRETSGPLHSWLDSRCLPPS